MAVVSQSALRETLRRNELSSQISILISSLAFLISATTLYLTFFRRGELRATQPTTIYFGPDGGKQSEPNKVYLRTLLFSTSRRGHVVESLHVNLTRGETRQNFSIWVYGERRQLSRGSGLFVGDEGLAANHHFVLPPQSNFSFVPGKYDMRLYAKCVGDKRPRKLASVTLLVNEAHSTAIERDGFGLYFDWGPEQQAYQAHVRKPKEEIPEALLEGG